MNRDGHGIPAEALELADRGEIVEAIKITRECTGLGLKDAKDAIDAYRRDPQGFSRSARSSAESGPVKVPHAAISAPEKGRLIDAIKHTREANGLGLKDAKEIVDRFLEKNPAVKARFKSASSEDLKRVTGNLLFVFSLLGLVAIGYWYLFGNSQ